jgi:hypothetical protein
LAERPIRIIHRKVARHIVHENSGSAAALAPAPSVARPEGNVSNPSILLESILGANQILGDESIIINSGDFHSICALSSWNITRFSIRILMRIYLK